MKILLYFIVTTLCFLGYAWLAITLVFSDLTWCNYIGWAIVFLVAMAFICSALVNDDYEGAEYESHGKKGRITPWLLIGLLVGIHFDSD